MRSLSSFYSWTPKGGAQLRRRTFAADPPPLVRPEPPVVHPVMQTQPDRRPRDAHWGRTIALVGVLVCQWFWFGLLWRR